HVTGVQTCALPICLCLQRVEELQLAGLESLVKIFQKEPSEQTRQHAHREEKTGAAGDPATAIGRDSAAWDNAVEMRMMQQVLTPTVEYSEETDFRAQMFGIGGNRA